MEYRSSADGAGPLLADVEFQPDGTRKPLLLVMHGYNGGREHCRPDIVDYAKLGIFAVSPDMRGRGGSGGTWDSGGLDVHDILDAAVEAVRRFPGEVDPRNLNVVGYSGGGGNAIACAVRFPDLFQTCVSFFGISDYAAWHAVNSRPDCVEVMDRTLGGTPEQVPEVYLARSANLAAANCVWSRLHFFWDEEETQCPPAPVEGFIRRYRAAALSNVAVHVSRRTDANRWLHGYRSDHASLKGPADSLFLRDVFAPKDSSPRIPERGRFVVPGYLVTRRFAVYIGDGQRGQVIVEYDISGNKPKVEVVHNPKNYEVRILEKSPLAGLP
jgi:pimeloyl-ACP methyl ester carboxylesterase